MAHVRQESAIRVILNVPLNSLDARERADNMSRHVLAPAA
jgi:hypothetical protein